MSEVHQNLVNLSIDMDGGQEQFLTADEQPQSIKHAEKVHFCFTVNDAELLDILETHAIQNGGTSHLDQQGRKYILYPIKYRITDQEGGETEMALLQQLDMGIEQIVGWADGCFVPWVTGDLYWAKVDVGAETMREAYNLQRQQVFYIADIPREGRNQKQTDLLEEMEAHSKAYRTKYYQVDLKDLVTFDRAIALMCQSLFDGSVAYIRNGIKSTIKNLILACFFLFGGLCNAQFYFFYLMDNKQWDYSIFLQILIYVGLGLGVLFQNILTYAIIFFFCDLCKPINRCCFNTKAHHEVLLVLAFSFLSIIGCILIGLYTFYQYRLNADFLLTLVNVGSGFGLVVIIGLIYFKREIVKLNILDAQARSQNYQKQRLSYVDKAQIFLVYFQQVNLIEWIRQAKLSLLFSFLFNFQCVHAR